MAKRRRRRLVKGNHFDAWAFKCPPDAPGQPEEEWVFCFFAESSPRRKAESPTDDGKWVRVKFMEVQTVTDD